MAETERKQSEKQNKSWTWRRLYRLLCGMPFSFVLLFIILLACVAGSVITQGQPTSFYVETYGLFSGLLLCKLRLDHIFTCWWFIVLVALLCLNLILCSISRFRAVYRVWCSRGKRYVGIWGSWLTHLGMLILIIGFAAGQYLSKEETLYGIPGSTQPLGDTGLSVTIDSFEVLMREDYTVEQYVAGLTVTNDKGESVSGTASVNHPLDAFGYSFYQDSMGWAVYVDILQGENVVKTDLLCAGEYTYPEEHRELVLLFNKFYPDLTEGEDGSLSTATPLLNNPHCLYTIYYNGNRMTMNLVEPGELIQVHSYGFKLYDPVEYTLIVAKSDPTAWLVGVSAVILMAGLVLAFYVRPWEENRRKNSAD